MTKRIKQDYNHPQLAIYSITTFVYPTYISTLQSLRFYKFQEYPVVIGNPESSRALCVVWQDTERVVKHFPEFKKHFALIGNLRSAFGINIMLYNLALNPHITEVILWGPDKLSNTPIGIVGRDILLNLWSNGCDEHGRINNAAFTLAPEIEQRVLHSILREVKLCDKSTEQRLEISSFSPLTNKPYMDAHVFPEIVVQTPDMLPSEKYTYLIRAPKGADAYLSLLTTVWKYGEETSIDAESENVKEARDTIVVVEHENPDEIVLPDWITTYSGLNITRESLEEYYKTQFSPDLYRKEIFPGVTTFERPRDYSYLYAELMYAFPRLPMIDNTLWWLYEREGYEKAKEFLTQNVQLLPEHSANLVVHVEQSIADEKKRLQILLEAFIPSFDQVANVIDRIKRKPNDLDKEIVLWDQRYHTHVESGRPCLFKLSFSVRHDTIDVHVFVRTHDIGKAWFFNFYGIARLLGKIAAETGKKTGFITIESQSAHIYKRDWETIKEIVHKEVTEKDARMYFDPIIDGDARGIVHVSVVDGKIKIKLQDTTTGKQLFETDGRTARELMYKMKHHNLISRIDHGVFIGSELAKAELCIKLGVEYKYDNPIQLPNGEKVMS